MPTATYKITNLVNRSGKNAVGVWFQTALIYGDFSGQKLTGVTITEVRLRIAGCKNTGTGPMTLTINGQTLTTDSIAWHDPATTFDLDVKLNGWNNNLFRTKSGECTLQPAKTTADGSLMIGVPTIYVDVKYTLPSAFQRAEGGELVTYSLFHAENGELIPYSAMLAKDGELIN